VRSPIWGGKRKERLSETTGGKNQNLPVKRQKLLSRSRIDKPTLSGLEEWVFVYGYYLEIRKRNDFPSVHCSSTGIQLSSRLPKVPRQEKCLAIVDEESSGHKVLIQIVKETAAAMRVALSDRMESRI